MLPEGHLQRGGERERGGREGYPALLSRCAAAARAPARIPMPLLIESQAAGGWEGGAGRGGAGLGERGPSERRGRAGRAVVVVVRRGLREGGGEVRIARCLLRGARAGLGLGLHREVKTVCQAAGRGAEARGGQGGGGHGHRFLVPVWVVVGRGLREGREGARSQQRPFSRGLLPGLPQPQACPDPRPALTLAVPPRPPSAHLRNRGRQVGEEGPQVVREAPTACLCGAPSWGAEWGGRGRGGAGRRGSECATRGAVLSVKAAAGQPPTTIAPPFPAPTFWACCPLGPAIAAAA